MIDGCTPQYAESDEIMDERTIRNTVSAMLERAVKALPPDVRTALEECESDGDGIDAVQVRTIMENIRKGEARGIPMCEDTGVPVFYVRYGRVPVPLHTVMDAIRAGLTDATDKAPLRPNSVHPLTRLSHGDNFGHRLPLIHVTSTDTEELEICVLTKGAGSENMSALAMLTPAAGVKGIKEFVLETVVKAGGNPCPPLVLGVGVGGTADTAMALAKRALLRPIDTFNQDPSMAQLEADLRAGLRDIGIGPMGLGGGPTVIGVNVEHANCHPASLPVGVNVQCWADRWAKATFRTDGTVEVLGGEQ